MHFFLAVLFKLFENFETLRSLREVSSFPNGFLLLVQSLSHRAQLIARKVVLVADAHLHFVLVAVVA